MGWNYSKSLLASSLIIRIHGTKRESSKWVRGAIRILTARSNVFEGTSDCPISCLIGMILKAKKQLLKPHKPELPMHKCKKTNKTKTLLYPPNYVIDLNESKCLLLTSG